MTLEIEYKLYKGKEEHYKKLAKGLGCKLVVKGMPTLNYDCSIWLDENDELCQKDFHTKKEALDYAKKVLKDNPSAYADLKHWNAKGDDYDYWFYRLENGKLKEVHDI